MDSWTDDKYVKIMADYCSDAIWAKDGCGELLDELPISEGLKGLLARWQRKYDLECDDYLPKSERRTPEFDKKEFSLEGLKIAMDVKKELSDWTVVYFDEWRSHNSPALDYEYEIR